MIVRPRKTLVAITHTVWSSNEVKGGGIVADRRVIANGAQRAIVESEVVGFGSAGKTEWGKTEAEENGKKPRSRRGLCEETLSSAHGRQAPTPSGGSAGESAADIQNHTNR